MRIAYINADFGIPLFGGKGAAVHVRDFTRALVQSGHHVRVLTARCGTPRSSYDVPFDTLDPADDGGDGGPEERALRLNQQTFAALSRSHAAGVPDLVYERYSLWSHAGLRFARRYGLPFVLEVNSPLLVEQSTYRSLARSATARRIERYLFSGATRIVAVSREVGDYVCAHGGDAARVVVAANGVDLSLYDEVPASRTDRDRFTIGFLGSLKPWHGVDVLVDALATLVARDSRYHLRIIGDGPERGRLEQTLQARNLLSHATLAGHVAREDVPRQLALVDCAVAPYPRLDGFYFSPLKVFEYMAAGRPIVASRIGQIEAVLEHRQTALLVEPGNPHALADALESLCCEPALASRLAQAARRRAFERHGWVHTVSASLAGLQRPASECGAHRRADLADPAGRGSGLDSRSAIEECVR